MNMIFQETTQLLPGSKHQSRFRFGFIVGSGRTTDDDSRTSVTTQRFLQNTRQLAVAIWYVTFLKKMTSLHMNPIHKHIAVTVPSANAAMTFPKADNDLLIFFASSNTVPSAPVLLTCNRTIRGRLAICGPKTHVLPSHCQPNRPSTAFRTTSSAFRHSLVSH